MTHYERGMMPSVDNNMFTNPQTERSTTIPRIPKKANCRPSERFPSSPPFMKKYFVMPHAKTRNARANMTGTMIVFMMPIIPVEPLPTKSLKEVAMLAGRERLHGLFNTESDGL